jgi:hypothetical protein
MAVVELSEAARPEIVIDARQSGFADTKSTIKVIGMAAIKVRCHYRDILGQ